MSYVLTFSERTTMAYLVSTTVAHAYPKPYQTPFFIPNSNVGILVRKLYTSMLTFLGEFQ